MRYFNLNSFTFDLNNESHCEVGHCLRMPKAIMHIHKANCARQIHRAEGEWWLTCRGSRGTCSSIVRSGHQKETSLPFEKHVTKLCLKRLHVPKEKAQLRTTDPTCQPIDGKTLSDNEHRTLQIEFTSYATGQNRLHLDKSHRSRIKAV